jgi:hypothetical protein
MTLQIKKAVKTRVKIRIALAGPAGSGKTLTSLRFAKVLAEGGKILVIDTEHGRASVYASRFDFDVVELDKFSPLIYVEALELAEQENYSVVVIDSLTHAWTGEGGVLEIVDKATARAKSNNSFTSGWSVGTPLHNQLINKIMAAPFHVIATMRAKTEYVMESTGGKSTPRKTGMAAIQRDNMDYEFNFYATMDREHTLSIEKSDPECFEVGDQIGLPDERVAAKMLTWLNDGAEPTPRAKQEDPPALATDAQLVALRDLAAKLGPNRHIIPADLTFQRANELGKAWKEELTRPSPQTVMNVEPFATDRQISSIHKLCAALSRPEPDVAMMTFATARELITQLTQAYSESRQAS